MTTPAQGLNVRGQVVQQVSVYVVGAQIPHSPTRLATLPTVRGNSLAQGRTRWRVFDKCFRHTLSVAVRTPEKHIAIFHASLESLAD